jgi:hypothetical protein
LNYLREKRAFLQETHGNLNNPNKRRGDGGKTIGLCCKLPFQLLYETLGSGGWWAQYQGAREENEGGV